ncbi:MAG TPA: porin [Nevskiales bacterium]|nr:porin [Nevskiales bacterium]
MSPHRPLWLGSLIAGLAIANPAFAANSDEARFEELEQKIKVLERKLEIQQEEAASKAKTAPVIKTGDKGLSFETADGNYQFKLNGLFQGDGRFFLDNGERKDLEDTFLLRRVRPTLQGQLGKYVGFRLTPEFAGDSATVVDAYVDLKFSPAATLRVGKQKGPVGLERLQSGGAIVFAERAFPTELAPNRDIGFQLQGDVLDNRLNYAVGIYNGTADGRDSPTSDADNEHELGARVFLTPFVNNPGSALQGLGFGLGVSHGKKESEVVGVQNSLLGRYRSPGQEQIFNYRNAAANFVTADGDHTRISPQFYYYRNSFGLIGEYITSEQALGKSNNAAIAEELKHKAWQLTASYVLTGEDNGFKGVAKPLNEFDLGKSGWGAFELAARVSKLEIDDKAFDGGADSFAERHVAVSEARSYGLGLNWYLNANTKLVFDYFNTSFKDGAGVAAAPEDRDDEKVFITRVQYQF